MLAFIRHGETKANRERRYLGKTDESLSEEGIERLESYKKQKLYPSTEVVFTSPMKRCMETAEILYPALCPIVIPEWEEINFGRFEYRNYEEIKDDKEYQEWIDSGGTLNFPDGESRNDFHLRCKSGFMRMCDELRLTAGKTGWNRFTAGVIVHGGIIMSLMSLFGGTDYFDCQVSNGRGYVCRLANLQEGAMREDMIKNREFFPEQICSSPQIGGFEREWGKDMRIEAVAKI